jgi:O-antigen ligase
MGAYGLVQFIAMPPWDSYWQQKVVEEVGYVNAIGGESGTAIWGTTNTNGTLALLLMPGILLLLTRQSSLSILAAVIGCLASLLTNSRTAWILVLIALFIVIGNLRSQLQIKIILFALVVGLLVLPLANIQPFSGMISSRLGTLSNVLHDSSFQGRSAQYTEFLEDGLLNPIGRGLSSVNHPDSGIINVIAEMGWLGATPFLGALILLVWQMFQASRENDLFMFVARAIAVPLIISPSGNFFSALPAFMIWFFAGMVMASHRYYQHQLNQP